MVTKIVRKKLPQPEPQQEVRVDPTNNVSLDLVGIINNLGSVNSTVIDNPTVIALDSYISVKDPVIHNNDLVIDNSTVFASNSYISNYSFGDGSNTKKTNYDYVMIDHIESSKKVLKCYTNDLDKTKKEELEKLYSRGPV